MATAWHDKRTYVDENKFVSAKLQQTHPRAHSVKKKQVFGELKNVMHNQIGITPMKGAGGLTTNRGCPATTQKSWKPVEVEHNKKMDSTLIDPIELFDLFDFPKLCCTNACIKSDAEIWAAQECNQLDEIALMKAMKKIRSGSRMIDDFEDQEELAKNKIAEEREMEELNKREDERLDNLLSKTLKSQLFLEDYGNDDFISCSAELPKFDIFNDLPLLNVN